jgi:hypothetical protein
MENTYDPDALRNDIKVSEANIERMEEAIRNERAIIAERKAMIKAIEMSKKSG